ncbi:MULTISPECIES: AAA family ATPase [unclassified Moraxella]|uniref:AAA family ATPase n=1 Tax=unclassified Moraxella TaxID=2685852 RepID=UPI003AF4804B
MGSEQNYAFKRLEISGYKSIQNIVIEDIPPLMVLAGANGSGKSNFVDALELLSQLLTENVEKLAQSINLKDKITYKVKQGKFDDRILYEIVIKSNKIKNERLYFPKNFVLYDANANFTFSKEELQEKIDECHSQKKILEEEIDRINFILEKQIAQNKTTENYKSAYFDIKKLNEISLELFDINLKIRDYEDKIRYLDIDEEFSLVQIYKNQISQIEELETFVSTLSNIKIFRINHLEAKKPSIDNSIHLKSDGSNLANILANLEQDDEMRATILDWLCLIVPEMQNVISDNRQLDGSKSIQFEEESGKKFPAHMVSDGTIYALSMLVAVLTRTQKAGITIIEEPERGLHPKAIGELIGFIRQHASHHHPIILTTHSESVVRELELDELFFVSKEQGITKIKSVKDSGVDKSQIPLDTAWLMNLLNGGLPW